MKSPHFFNLLLVFAILSSCTSTTYYQVYKTEPTEQIIQEDEFIVYKDDNCEILYNLWGNGGNSGFIFHNITEENIYLNKHESFFLLNGIANNYYKNRTYTSTRGTGTSSSNSESASKSITGLNFQNLIQTNKVSTAGGSSNIFSSEYSVSITEEKIICIPSQSSKIIDEYNVVENLIRDCDLLRYPDKESEIATLKFEESESPIIFSNRIQYTVGMNGNPITVENEFYVSEITNYPLKMMTEKVREEYCGQESLETEIKLKYFSPYHFYLRYKKSDDFWEY